MKVLGIDIGGTGVKGAPIDTRRGVLTARRYRVPTPEPATPEAIAATIVRIVEHFRWRGPIGCSMPAVVKRGLVRTAANISRSWLGVNAVRTFANATGCRVSVINDADAAGEAEMRFGAGRDRSGVVMVVTLGTGIGTALFTERQLVPNTELGHLTLRGRAAERWAAESVRGTKRLSWKKWSRRLDEYLHLLHRYFWPDLIIIGGGVSRKWRKFIPRLTLPTPIVPAKLRNEAGILGAALAYESAAGQRSSRRKRRRHPSARRRGGAQ